MSGNRIFWIDDNKEREKDAKSLGGLFIEYNEKIFDRLENLTKNKKPDLILIDIKLDKRNVPNLPKRGFTIAEYLRERIENRPIIGYSVHPDYSKGYKGSLLYERNPVYDDVFSLDYIENNYEIIQNISKDYKELRRRASKITTTEGIMKLIDAPKNDYELLKETLPSSILTVIDSDQTFDILILAKWIRKKIMETPGFLYDPLYAATHVGMKEEKFLKKNIQSIFKGAEYSGIFSETKKSKLWWVSRLEEIVFKESKWKENLSWKAGHYIDKISKKDKAKCFKCEELYPEIVGYTEPSKDKEAPLHRSCSKPHPNKKKYHLFDEPRLIIVD